MMAGMKKCPYCKAEIPDDALKCQHCGEWVTARSRRQGDSLGRAANRWVSFNILAALVVLILMLIFFFAFFLPHWNEGWRRFSP